jgi:hypothetical protein
VPAEQLIALEAAFAELANLYVVAKRYRPLRARADAELLPRTSTMAANLRSLIRHRTLDDAAIDTAARDISGLRQDWRGTLEALHRGPIYQSCLTAWHGRDRAQLITLLPRLFVDCEHVPSPPVLHYPISPSSGRRRPGHSPFVSPATCAEQIATLRHEGIEAETGGTDWWDTELASITFSSDAEALDAPTALQFDGAEIGDPVFRTGEPDTFRVYAPRLVAPFRVVLQADVDDEWWQAFSGSYADWRDALASALRTAAIGVAVHAQDRARDD